MAAARDNTLPDPPIPEGDHDRLLAGRYSFVRLLGEGGTGRVYLAEDRRLSRQVAVKVVRPSLCDNPEVRGRIERECRLHAAIGVHPNIVALYDRIDEQGEIHLVMEYVAGRTLADLLADRAATEELPVAVTVDIAGQLLAALACIHAHAIIHRDIKASNVMVRAESEGGVSVKLMDFGIARQEDDDPRARLTRLDSRGPGTPAYMAPERIDPRRYGPVGPATDLYGVGVLLYEMVAGRPPFAGSISEVFHGHLDRQPDLSALAPAGPALVRVVARALAKEPDRRFPDADSFRRALAQTLAPGEGDREKSAGTPTLLHCAGDGTRDDPEGRTLADPVPVAPGRGRRLVVCAMAAALLLLLVLAAYRGLHRHDQEQGPPPVAGPPPSPVVTGPSGQGELAAAGNETGTSALRELENRRGGKEAGADEGTAAETSADWEIIEIRDRKIR